MTVMMNNTIVRSSGGSSVSKRKSCLYEVDALSPARRIRDADGSPWPELGEAG